VELELAIVTGVLFAAGVYMLLRRNIVKLVIGLVLLSHAVNLLIFTSAGLTRGKPAFIAEGADYPIPPYADPLPQALILTAIVIGFGVMAFTLVLFKRAYAEVGTDDLDQMKSTDSETLPL
jgi:multicomponent Na+:H+ antiporter subunit C